MGWHGARRSGRESGRRCEEWRREVEVGGADEAGGRRRSVGRWLSPAILG